MKTMLILYIALLPVTAFGQIGAKVKSGGETGVAGTWENNEFGFTMTLLLNPDGSGEFDGESFQYKVAGNQLSLVYPEGTINYIHQVNGNKMTLSGGDLETPVVFTLRGGGSWNASEGAKANAISLSQPVQVQIIGKWDGNGESMDFRADGTVLIQGYSLPYSVSGNQLTIQGGNGSQTFQYSISGDHLTVSINGQNSVYKKSGSQGVSANNQNAASGQGATNPGNGIIALELVGKWCYVNVSSTSTGGWSTDECIVINGDGSYEYSYESSGSATGYNQYGDQTFYGGTASQDSDRGTWRLDGGTLYVQSQSRGDQTYTLQKVNHPKNNDPMIVIDGRSYVTYYQKSPW